MAISNHGSVALHKDGSATIWNPTFDPNDHLKMTVKYFPIKGVINAKTIVVAGHEALILGDDSGVNMLTVYNSFYDRYRLEREFREIKPLVTSSITGIAPTGPKCSCSMRTGRSLRWNGNTKEQVPVAVKGLKDIEEIRTGFNRLYMLKMTARSGSGIIRTRRRSLFK